MASIDEKVKEIVKAQLGPSSPKVVKEAKFTDLGADSLNMAEIVLETEQTFGIVISDEDVEKIETVGDLIDQVKRQTGA